MRGAAICLSVVLAHVPASCKREVALAPIWIDLDEVAVGAFGDLDGGNVLGTVRDAVLSTNGRYLAVMDRDDPFLHIIDRTTGQSLVFGPEGDGPGEIKFPMSLAFSGDSVLAVLRTGGVDLFSTDGGFIDRISTFELGFSPQAITDGCGGEFFLYGLMPTERGAEEPHWLHRLKALARPVSTTPLLPIAGRSAVKWGALEGLDGSDESVLLWHRTNSTETGWVLDCRQESVSLLDERLNPVEVRQALRDERAGGSVMTLPDTLFGGAVVSSHVFLVAHTVRAESGEYGEGHTLIRSWTPDGAGCVTVAGRATVLDAEADLVVLSVSEPFPRVLVVPFSVLQGLDVTGRPCG